MNRFSQNSRLFLTIALLISGLVSELVASPEPSGKYSAKASLQALELIRGKLVASTVTGVTGFFGQDQPQQWRLLAMDARVPNLYHEFAVQDGKIVAERHFSGRPDEDLPRIRIQPNTVRFDSTQAFQIAERNARNASVGFDSVHYQLRCRDLRNEPVWVINLIDQRQNAVGVQYISAVTGQTLRVVWNRPGTQQYTSVNKEEGILAKIGKGIEGAGKTLVGKSNPQKSNARQAPSFARQTSVSAAAPPVQPKPATTTPNQRSVVPLPPR